MMKRIDIDTRERGVLKVNGRPTEWLGPGRYRRWEIFDKLEVDRLWTHTLLAALTPEQAALAPAAEIEVLELKPHERAVLWHQGAPAQWLRAGRHYLWKVDPSVRAEVIDTSAEATGGVATKPLRPAVQAIVDSRDYVEVTAAAGTVALRYVDGDLDAKLGPGRHAAWTTEREVRYAVLDLRERILNVGGQEVMTKDRVSLRLNLAATFKIVDPERVATVARDADEVLYLAVQMASREAVTSRTLDTLLEDRDALAADVFDEVKRRGLGVGLEVSHLGLKDIVLPGDMKALLNRVIEAKKQAEANVILRREEASATRAMAQTAKLLSEQPTLMRLKELEAYKELAHTVGQVHLVMGEQTLSKLELKA